MDHYGLRHSGSIGHVEYVPAQVTIFAWYTVFFSMAPGSLPAPPAAGDPGRSLPGPVPATKNQTLFSVFPVKMAHHDPSHSL